MSDPKYIYDPEDWDYTLPYEDKSVYQDYADLSPGEHKVFKTLVEGPDRFLACVILTRDDEGDPDETEYRWFDTEEEAKSLVSMSRNGVPSSIPINGKQDSKE